MVFAQACLVLVGRVASSQAADENPSSVAGAATLASPILFDTPTSAPAPAFMPPPGRDKFRLDLSDLFLGFELDRFGLQLHGAVR